MYLYLEGERKRCTCTWRVRERDVPVPGGYDKEMYLEDERKRFTWRMEKEIYLEDGERDLPGGWRKAGPAAATGSKRESGWTAFWQHVT
jgi:hypothetical protein